MGADLQIVFFTNKNSNGAELLRSLKKNNIPIRAIFIESSSLKENKDKLVRLLIKSGLKEALKTIFERLKIMFIFSKQDNWLSNGFYWNYSNDIYIVDDFNGERCVSLLKNINPDIIILGGSRIIRNNIISIPQIGIINAHPGILPKYRGVDVIRWAVYNRDNVGVTVHFIDSGVDTGRIIMQKVIPLELNDTITSLIRKAEVIGAELVTEVILKLKKGENLQLLDQLKESGKQYYLMPANLRKEADRRLKQTLDESVYNKIQNRRKI
jgi:methionyl-tRNA formyltransferase